MNHQKIYVPVYTSPDKHMVTINVCPITTISSPKIKVGSLIYE